MDQTLTPAAKDALMEVMNIGASHAATSLSQLVSQEVQVTAPRLDLLSIEQVPEFVGQTDGVMSTVILKVLGDAPGVMMLMFPQESALQIANLLTRREKDPAWGSINRSALEEVGNILVGSCLTSLSNFLHMNFIQSIPNMATDMVGSLLDTVLADLGKDAQRILVSEVHFRVPGLPAEGGIYFLFNPSSTDKILKATTALLS